MGVFCYFRANLDTNKKIYETPLENLTLSMPTTGRLAVYKRKYFDVEPEIFS